MAMPAPDHVANLYAVPLAEFTATRNRIAAELRKAGRTSDVRAVARIRKPSASLWAVNRLAGTDRKGLASLTMTWGRVRRTLGSDPGRAAGDSDRPRRSGVHGPAASTGPLPPASPLGKGRAWARG
jgi:hypothetical protein